MSSNVARVVKKNMQRANVPLETKPAENARNVVILEPFAETKLSAAVTSAVVKIMNPRNNVLLGTRPAANVRNLAILKTFAQTLFHSAVLIAVVNIMKRAIVPLGTKPAANA